MKKYDHRGCNNDPIPVKLCRHCVAKMFKFSSGGLGSKKNSPFLFVPSFQKFMEPGTWEWPLTLTPSSKVFPKRIKVGVD